MGNFNVGWSFYISIFKTDKIKEKQQVALQFQIFGDYLPRGVMLFYLGGLYIYITPMFAVSVVTCFMIVVKV